MFKPHLRINGLTLVLLVVAMSAHATEFSPTLLLDLQTFLDSHPVLTPLLFLALYTLVVLTFLPSPFVCLLAGVLYGPWLGGLLNVAGATLGGVIAFTIARHLAADWVEQRMSQTLRQVKQGVEAEGWRFVAFVRLLPLVPYDLSCYAFGLTRIPLPVFAITSAICLLPRLIIYAYIGHRGAELLAQEGERLLQLSSLLALFVALLLFPKIYRRIRR